MSAGSHLDQADHAGSVLRKDINRARQAAEALFAPKRFVTEHARPASALSADQMPRKPRILSAVQVRPDVESAKLPVEHESSRPRQQVPTTHSGRIRTWLKYGMTIRQAAEVYGVNVSEIEHMLQRD